MSGGGGGGGGGGEGRCSAWFSISHRLSIQMCDGFDPSATEAQDLACGDELLGVGERKKEVELHSEMWGKGVCDIWEKWGWREKEDVELHSEMWGKGVCDIWEKWGWREKK